MQATSVELQGLKLSWLAQVSMQAVMYRESSHSECCARVGRRPTRDGLSLEHSIAPDKRGNDEDGEGEAHTGCV